MREIRLSRSDYTFCIEFVAKMSPEEVSFVQRNRQLPSMRLTNYEIEKLRSGFKPIIIAAICAGSALQIHQRRYPPFI